jgi:4-amino-4-deoxy-L-arabinose transferase-like glycosyltransferase
MHVLRGMDRRAWIVLLLLSAMVTTARVYTASEPLERDIAVYAVVAHEVLQGKSFYTEIWDNKPPGIHTVCALAELAVGYGPEAIMWLNVVGSLAVLWAMFFAAGGRGAWKVGCWAAAFWALLSGTVSLQANQPNTELFINLMLVVAFGLAARLTPDRRSISLCIGIGFVLGLASLFKQVVAAWFLALGVAYLIHYRNTPHFWRRMAAQAAFIAGTPAAMWLLLFGYFGITDRGSDFIDTIFRYGAYYSGNPFQSALAGFRPRNLAPEYFRFAIPLLLVVIPTTIWGTVRRPDAHSRPWFLLLGYIIACPMMIALPGRFFPHYFQLWLPVLALGLAWLVERCGSPMRRLSVGFVLLAFLGSLAWNDYRLSPEKISIRKYGRQFIEVRDLAEKIPLYVDEDETLYQWGIEPGYHFYANRRPASRHVWCEYLMRGPGWQKRLRETLEDLRANAPPLVIVDTRYCPPHPRSRPFFRWLQAEYESSPDLPRSRFARFWIRRDREG